MKSQVSRAFSAAMVVALLALFAGAAAGPSVYADPLPPISPLQTPTPVPLPTSVPPPTGVPPTSVPPANILGYHTVRYGETLYCIGRAYTILPWAIATQNGLVYPYYLYAGQVLAIPNVPWTAVTPGKICQAQFGNAPVPPPGPPGPPPPPPSGCRATHLVLYGDTLSSIARRYGTSVWAIATANNIANPNLIFAGQRLCIP